MTFLSEIKNFVQVFYYIVCVNHFLVSITQEEGEVKDLRYLGIMEYRLIHN